jgi:hypothetical protein
VMATCVDVGGADYPKTVAGQEITPMEGVSLVPAMGGESLERPNPIFWEHEANCAIREGKWKLVCKGSQGSGVTTPWELYDMEADRTETNDLAAEHPEKVKELSAKWEAWAERAKVKPWPWGRKRRKSTAKLNSKKLFTLKPGDDLPREEAPNTSDMPLRIEVSVDKPGDGVIVAQGGYSLGYTLYVEDGKVKFATRHGGKLTVVGAEQPLSNGESAIIVTVDKSGRVNLRVNDSITASGKTPGTIQTPIDGLTVGTDGGDPVAEYVGPVKFAGQIQGVVIKLGQ